MKRTLANCKYITSQGSPGTEMGMCLGFGVSENDDEPCEKCKKCKLHYLYFEEHGYKGFHAEINYLDGILYGRISRIKDLVLFEGTAETIWKEFKAAVDDYLGFCKRIGKQPR